MLLYFLEKLFFCEFYVVHFDHDDEEENRGQAQNGYDADKEGSILRHYFFYCILVACKGILLESLKQLPLAVVVHKISETQNLLVVDIGGVAYVDWHSAGAEGVFLR